MTKLNVDWIITNSIKVLLPFFFVSYLVFLGIRFFYYRDIFSSSDFVHYWVAAFMARSGEPAAAYDFSRLQAFGQGITGLRVTVPWFNTPIFLMMLLPFAWFPYLGSLFLWILITLWGYVVTIRRIAPHPLVTWLALTFPGTLLNINYGQNGLLSVIFFGGGFLLLDQSPIAAGILLGLLTYKPQLALLVPVVLAVAGRWQALAAMLITSIGLILASGLLFGFDVWLVFLKKIVVLLGALKTGEIAAVTAVPLWKMPTIFAAVKSLGAGALNAALLQTVVALSAAGMVAWVWYSKASLPMRVSALALGTFLVTPYCFVYDTALLAIPLAYLGWEGYTKGWVTGEKFCLIFGWISPLFLGLSNAPTLLLVPIILLSCLVAWRLRLERQPVSTG